MQRRVWLSVPTYTGEVEPEMGEALKAAVREIEEKRGWPIVFARWCGDGLIANARNGVIAQFLKDNGEEPPYTDLVFWDSDVVPESGALIRLLEHEVDVVAGVYPVRHPPERYAVLYMDDQRHLHPDAETGLVEVAGVPAGFLRITRTAIERMISHYADREYDHQLGMTAWCLFDCELRGRVYWGEDTTFCRRWREIGGKVWADPTLKIDHIGWVNGLNPNEGKRFYKGDYGGWLAMQRLAALSAPDKAAEADEFAADIEIAKCILRERGIDVGDSGESSPAPAQPETPDRASVSPREPWDFSRAGEIIPVPIQPETLSKPRIMGKSDKRLAISLATRGRPDLLEWTIEKTLENVRNEATMLMVAIDEDDAPTLKRMASWPSHRQVTISVQRREDTVAEKWNRVLRVHPADAYLLMVDYAPIVTPGFDAVILEAAGLWPDGIGVVVNERANWSFNKMQAITHGLAERMGYLYPEHFPYWFVDHWMKDVSEMIGRVCYAPFACDTARRPGTQELREVAFWATYYDLLQPERHALAERIFADPAFATPDWGKDVLRRNWALIDEYSQKFVNEQARRTPSTAAGDGGPRYARIKDKALARMRVLGSWDLTMPKSPAKLVVPCAAS